MFAVAVVALKQSFVAALNQILAAVVVVAAVTFATGYIAQTASSAC